MGSDRSRRTFSSMGARAATSGLTRRPSARGGTGKRRSPRTSTFRRLVAFIGAPRSVDGLTRTVRWSVAAPRHASDEALRPASAAEFRSYAQAPLHAPAGASPMAQKWRRWCSASVATRMESGCDSHILSSSDSFAPTKDSSARRRPPPGCA